MNALGKKKNRAGKEYKKILRVESKKYRNEFIDKLRSLKSSDPKAFWNVLNGKADTASASSMPSCEEFVEHFHDLNACNDEEEVIDNSDCVNDDLNRPFTEEEIIAELKILWS